jgi:hypothetical protein
LAAQLIFAIADAIIIVLNPTGSQAAITPATTAAAINALNTLTSTTTFASGSESQMNLIF